MILTIETDRLLIRELSAEDENGLFELDSDPEVHRYLGNKPVKTREEIRAVILNIRQQYKDNGIGRWAVIEKSTGNFIGWTGLKFMKTPVNNHSDYYDLGYRFIKKYWGKGYATETALASLKHGFETMHLSEIYAMTEVGNIASKNVLEKVGLYCMETFDYEGEEHYWLRITKEQWLMKQSKPFIS